MTYYVICINKHPTHQDPHNRIQFIGTNTTRGATQYTNKWAIDDVIRAIDHGGDTLYCTDKRGDLVRCITATHLGHKYVKTENDGIQPDNLLSQPDCA